MIERFTDRIDAGRQLGEHLRLLALGENPLVLALPRGGVPVGYEVAKAIGAELDILVVRKLGLPMHPELAMGAISSGGSEYLNQEVISMAGVTPHEIDAVRQAELAELNRREQRYRGNRARPNLKDRTVILVDDGIATGASMLTAIQAVRLMSERRIVVAIPVAPADARTTFKSVVDDYVCLMEPQAFGAVGEFYYLFDQVEDQEVIDLLNR